MKTGPQFRTFRCTTALILAGSIASLLALAANPLHASNWTGGDQSWSSNGNPGWNGTGVPNAAGATAIHNVSTTSNTTVDGAFTVGTISLTNNSANSWTITNATAQTLTLDNSGAGAVISNTNTVADTANTLSFNGVAGQVLTVALADNLSISNTGNSTRVGGAIAFNSDSAITGTNKNITINNVLNDTASINPTGSIRFNGGTNTFTGTVAIQTGLTTFTNNSSFGNVAANTITIGQAGATSASLLSTSTVTIANNIVAASTSGTNILGTTSTATVNYNGTLTLTGALTVQSASTATNGLTLGGVISGAGALTKTGSGIVTLSQANSFSGQLTVQAGTLSIGTINNESTNGVLGNSANSVVLGASGGNLGTLRYTGGSASSNKKFDMATGGTGAIQVDTTATNLTLSGVISGGGNLRKTGTGTLTLSGPNTFSGALEVRDGTLAIGTINDASSDGVLGNSSNSVGLGAAGTATLQYTGGTAASTKNFAVASGGTGVFQVDTGATTLTLSGVMSGSGTSNLSKTGAGTLTFSGGSANTYGGLTTVSAGELDLNKTAGVDAIAGNVTISGGTLKLLANNQIKDTATVTMSSGAFNLNGQTETVTTFTNSGGTFTTGVGGHLTGTGATVTWSGGTNTVNDGGLVDDAHIVISGGTNTVEGGATGGVLRLNSGGAGLEMSNGSTLTLNSDNTVAGKLLLDGATANVSVTGNSTVTIANGAGGTNLGNIDLGTGNRTFTVADGTAATDLLVSAVITNGSLTKDGAGTLSLTNAANNFTGTTTVSGGTLQLGDGAGGATGALTGTTQVAVNTGGTLLLGSSTTNQINNAATVTLGGGTITLGTSGMNETVGALTLTGNSVIDFGSLSTARLNFADSSAISWSSYTLSIYNWTAGTDQLYFGSNNSGLTSTQLNQISFFTGSGTGYVGTGAFNLTPFDGANGEVSPVPEPSSVLVGLSLLCLAGYRERRWFLRCRAVPPR